MTSAATTSASAVTTSAGRVLALALATLLYLAGCSTAVDGPGAPVAGSTTAEMRDAAVQVAERAGVALTSLDHRDPDAGYDRLLELLTGPARQEWEQRRGEYLAMITSGAVTAERATVNASGVAALDPAAPTATVLVAATAMVTTNQTTAPEKRRYRLQMSLIRTSAEWKVSQLQLVS